MKNFKIGDRVVAKVPVGCKDAEDQHGTVIGFNSVDISVEFDKDIGGHTCGKQTEGRDAKDGYGWFVLPRNLKPETSRFKVGQIYRSNCDDAEKGNIVRIKKISGKWIKYDTIRGEKLATGFAEGSPFAEGLVLLTGKEIGKAIRKWDNEHFKKETGVREEERYAKVGEYVKVISGDGHAVPVGSIVKVTGADNEGWIRVKCCPEGYVDTLRTGQYVALKGYKPEQKEERRKAKVGDTIKILPHAVDIQLGYKPGDTVFIDGVKEKPAPDGFIWGCGASYSDDDAKNEYVIISSGKHSYTAEQIEKAKQIVLDTIREQAEQRKYVLFSNTVNDPQDNAGYYAYVTGGEGCHFGIIEDKDSRYYGAFISDSTERAGAKCSPNDEPNEWIGKCVALCKVLHKPIPAFIMEG